ncbi:MAG: class I SAM-dependent methyltransferase [Candidatus Omnitrophota bacterium]|nr:class I SAM-dependent methyltransferase [Candidatus Omnitrophota bacterium]
MTPIPSNILAYIRRDMRNVPGWLRKGAAELIAEISCAQTEAGIKGDIYEIGVYHGKLTILLALLRSDNERIRVCDVFSDQKQNVDNSGGSETTSCSQFIANVARYLKEDIPNHRFLIDAASSLTLSLDKVEKNNRLFSIDGSHRDDIVEKDFRLAISGLSARGCIIHDDYFNCFWPGVSVAVSKVLLEQKETVAPFLIGFNKYFVCRVSELDWYHKVTESLKVRAKRNGWSVEKSEIFGRSVAIICDKSDVSYYNFHAEYSLHQKLERVVAVFMGRLGVVAGRARRFLAGLVHG